MNVRDILIALAMAAAVAGIVLWQKSSAPAAPSGTATTTTGLTLADVAAHNTRADCWTVINGGVYDLTSWIPQHPGGEAAILGLCGTDGSARFNGQHGGAATQAAILAGFKIGDLAGATTTSVAAPAAAPVIDDRGRNRGRGGDD